LDALQAGKQLPSGEKGGGRIQDNCEIGGTSLLRTRLFELGGLPEAPLLLNPEKGLKKRTGGGGFEDGGNSLPVQVEKEVRVTRKK